MPIAMKAHKKTTEIPSYSILLELIEIAISPMSIITMQETKIERIRDLVKIHLHMILY